MEFVTPESYAAHLATYIASPTKIEALVKLEFDRAPPLSQIAQARLNVERLARRFQQVAALRTSRDSDGEDWRPASLLVRHKREPIVERTKDYIVIETPLCNPFLGAFMADNLVKSVARDFKLTAHDIRSDRRFKGLVHARAVIARILKERGWSYPRTARAIGRGDHSTAMNSVDKFTIYARENPLVQQSYDRHARLMREAAEERQEASLAA